MREGAQVGLDAKIDFVAEFARIRAMTPKGVSQTPAWKIVREERDRR